MSCHLQFEHKHTHSLSHLEVAVDIIVADTVSSRCKDIEESKDHGFKL